MQFVVFQKFTSVVNNLQVTISVTLQFYLTNGGNFIGWKFDKWIQVKVHSLSPSHVWKLGSFFLQWKAVFLTVELKNLTKKQRKNFLWFWCSFLAKCFSSGWETVCKKLLSLVQVTLTNYTSLHWFGMNWHVLNQSECRNCCLYIIKQKKYTNNHWWYK